MFEPEDEKNDGLGYGGAQAHVLPNMEFSEMQSVVSNRKCVVCQSPIVVSVVTLVDKVSRLPISINGEFALAQTEVRCQKSDCALLYSAALARELLPDIKS